MVLRECPIPCSVPSRSRDAAGGGRLRTLARAAATTLSFSRARFTVVLAGLCITTGVIGSTLGGCGRSDDGRTATLYCSVDEPFAKEVIAAFEKQTGIRVQLKTDTEAGKTTGLVRRIEAEASRPQADVFWSSELFNTIKLARQGLFAEYRPPAVGIPDRYKDPAGKWTAFGLRARVLAYNTAKLKREDLPAQWRAISDARWKGQLGVADPRFGTTRGHFAAFLLAWGESGYVEFLDRLAGNLTVGLQTGNADAARLVGSGQLLVCATDTDDVYARQNLKEPIDLVYPDMGDGGTLLIPNSVALVTGAPHPEAARKLIDFLASEQTERMLAASESKNIPVRQSLRDALGVRLPPETKLTFDQIADAMDRAIELAGQRLVK
jgi:iron(III) transport system substrate-binding protein